LPQYTGQTDLQTDRPRQTDTHRPTDGWSEYWMKMTIGRFCFIEGDDTA